MSDIKREEIVSDEEFDRLVREWLHERAEVTESYVEGYLGGSGLMLDFVPDEPGKRFYVIRADWLEADNE